MNIALGALQLGTLTSNRAEWCAQAGWYNPVAWFACLDYDIGNVVAGEIKGDLPGPTVTPGTGTPVPPGNYDPETGACLDAAGAVAPCMTDTPGTPIHYDTPVPPDSASSACDAWFCTYLDVGCGDCTLFSNSFSMLIIAGLLAGTALFLFQRR